MSTSCADHDHGGFTNDFLVNTHNALAIRYNDDSPLVCPALVLYEGDEGPGDALQSGEHNRHGICTYVQTGMEYATAAP